MGKVAVTFRILPDSPEVDTESLISLISAGVPELKGTAVRPFAFGLQAILATVIVPDEGEGFQTVETFLRGLPGVQGVEVEAQSLL